MRTKDSESVESPHQADEADAPLETESLLELLEISMADRAADVALEPLPSRIEGVVIARLVTVEPVVTIHWKGIESAVGAKTMVRLDAKHVGRDVALMFEEHDPSRPLVMGLIEPSPATATHTVPTAPVSVEVTTTNKERVVLDAVDELVLRCGKASITLTKAGKILIHGAYVSSTASGTNRIRGGAVEIN